VKFSPRQQLRIARSAVLRDRPVYAHWGITHRCGLTCKMCGIWRYGNREEELELDQIDVMAQRMARLGVAHVAIGGGEPFEREDLAEVVALFVAQGIKPRVLTNGVTTPRPLLDAVIDAGCVDFSVSLDSLYPERYDDICEQPGSWTRGIKTMLHIAERTLPLGGMPTINCVVSNVNLDEITAMARFAQFLGFAVSLLPIELLATASAGAQDWEARFIRYRPEMGIAQDEPASVRKRVSGVYDEIIAMKRSGMPILNSTPYLEASRNYLITGRFPPEGCHAGRLYFSVAPNGQFTICHRKAHDHMSFLDPDFESYFQSDAYRAIADKDARNCEGCMRACWIDTSYMFSTMQGFLETAFMTLKPRRHTAPTFEEALGWARFDHDSGPSAAVAK
jgi:MoaA/NifB/PqqE/SkfB family radical SAM enzyme